ncbi:MAG: alanine racemase [Armatimonadetes bacterium]|nr:alanine racemase [Armatimonadota bacterium]
MTRAWAEIDANALRHNLERIAEHVGSNCGVMAVVKANAYGHGVELVAKALEGSRARMFGVATLEEGALLRRRGIRKPILLFAPLQGEEWEAAAELGLMATVEDPRTVPKLRKTLKVHLKVDTGMSRLGAPCGRPIVWPNDRPDLELEGAYTHFALAEIEQEFAKQQLALFHQATSQLPLGLRHAANSPATVNLPESWLDIVRPGLMLYGIKPFSVPIPIDLRPVMTLKARVISIRTVQRGQGVSYGHRFKSTRETRIATVGIGYADGIPRRLSDMGSVLIRGRRTPIAGTICMDMTMIDATEIEGAQIGDIATLIGRDGEEQITVEEIAETIGSSRHEIVTCIGPRPQRILVNG